MSVDASDGAGSSGLLSDAGAAPSSAAGASGGEESVLDNAPWHALTGPHARFAIGGDLARRYPDDVAPFVAVRTWDDPHVWDALLELVGTGAEVGVSGYDGELPAGTLATGSRLTLPGRSVVLLKAAVPLSSVELLRLQEQHAAVAADPRQRGRRGR